jgi:predicted GH43/DUF377 family glycosyl hydrolase
LLTTTKLGIILTKTDSAFEAEGVLNPAVIKVNDTIHLFYRAVAKENYSTIGYCKLTSPLLVQSRNIAPLLYAEADYEQHGLEDPRIVLIDGLYYLTYTAYDGVNALGALATSIDLITWQKHGIIVPQITYDEFFSLANGANDEGKKYERYNSFQKSDDDESKKLIWDKNFVLFPRKINSKFYFMHRIRPEIQIVVEVESLNSLTNEFWKDYFINFKNYVVLSPKYQHELSYIGCGCPPIETELGWIVIYHGVRDSIKGYIYSACAALLDLHNPRIEIARLPYPLFFPEKSWELKGEVNNVCFPTGVVLENELLYIYYGAADERIAVASLNINELLKELLIYKN